jgi:hypothetical protein
LDPGVHGSEPTGNSGAKNCESHATWLVSSGLVSGGTVWPLQTGFSCWRPEGELVTPFGSVFPLKQLVGAAVSVISPKSPFVSFPKNPSLLKELFSSALPQSS